MKLPSIFGVSNPVTIPAKKECTEVRVSVSIGMVDKVTFHFRYDKPILKTTRRIPTISEIGDSTFTSRQFATSTFVSWR